MKFRYLSSDFLASYNEIMEELEEKQALIDTIYQEKVEELLQREKLRLEKIAPHTFEVGEEVILDSGREGKIVGSKIEFNVIKDGLDDYGNPLYGPGRFYRIESPEAEEIATCEGDFRMYIVESEPSDLAKDWGHTSVIEKVYPDEVRKK